MLKRLLKFNGTFCREPGQLEMALGAPAFAGLVLSVLVIWSSSQNAQETVSDRYFVAAMKADHQGDADTAKLWLAKVLQLKPGDPAATFRVAIIAMKEKDYAKAKRIITALAPEKKAKYPPAHLFVASELLRKARGTSDLHTQKRIRRHLNAALTNSPGNRRALQMLAEFELQNQNINDSIKCYRMLESRDPTINLVLAQLHVAKGAKVEAEQAAQRGLRHFKEVARQDLTDIDARIEWARLEVFLENYSEAATLLGKVAAFQRIPDSRKEKLRRSLADVYFSWSKAIGNKTPQSINQRIKLLEMSLRFAPEQSRMYQSLTQLKSELPESKQTVDAMLSELAENDTVAPVVHLNLAIEAVRSGDLTLEREHLELALRAAPRLGVAANNLAWNLANTAPSQLKRALELANQAVHDEPERFEFRATRGRILAMVDRSGEAIQDLELAALRLNHRSDISTALSSLYQRVDSDSNRRNPLRIQLN